MKRMMVMLKRFWNEDGGGTSVEYALMLALIFMAVVGTVKVLSINVLSLFTDYNAKYDAATR